MPATPRTHSPRRGRPVGGPALAHEDPDGAHELAYLDDDQDGYEFGTRLFVVRNAWTGLGAASQPDPDRYVVMLGQEIQGIWEAYRKLKAAHNRQAKKASSRRRQTRASGASKR